MRKRIFILSLILLLIAGTLTLCLIYLLPDATKAPDTPQISTKKADNDFSDLFRLTHRRGDALAAVTVTAVKEVTDLIEKYEVTDTLYTKVTVSVDEEYTDRLKGEKTLTIMILGNGENFPDREQLKVGNSYLLRLESWVHESGMIYLLNPLESTYLRIFEGEILVRESADLPNYRKAMTPEELAHSWKEYCQQNPGDKDVLAEHYKEILATLEAYDYQNSELAYRPEPTAIDSRLALAKKLCN